MALKKCRSFFTADNLVPLRSHSSSVFPTFYIINVACPALKNLHVQNQDIIENVSLCINLDIFYTKPTNCYHQQ